MRLGVAGALVDGVVVRGDVSIDGGSRIDAVGLPGGGGAGLAVPGLVDLQVNGVGRIDFRSADPAGHHEAAELLAAGGATAVQPTFHSQSVADHERSLHVLAEVLANPPPGCRLLPAHLEGPFLSRRWAGAHEPQHLIDPDPDVLDRLLAAGPVGMVTLAPELPGAEGAIRRLVEQRVVVAAGHTDATAEQFARAVAGGLGHLTHCWNAHRRLTARDPGPAGAALAADDLVVGLVGDLVHVAAEVVVLTLRGCAASVAGAPARAAPTRRPGGRGGARRLARAAADPRRRRRTLACVTRRSHLTAWSSGRDTADAPAETPCPTRRTHGTAHRPEDHRGRRHRTGALCGDDAVGHGGGRGPHRPLRERGGR